MYFVYICVYVSDVIYSICEMALIKNRFHLLEFEDGIQIVPDNWIQKDTNECWYPNYKTDKEINKAIKKRHIPQDDWLLYSIKRLFGIYGKCECITRVLNLLFMCKLL